MDELIVTFNLGENGTGKIHLPAHKTVQPNRVKSWANHFDEWVAYGKEGESPEEQLSGFELDVLEALLDWGRTMGAEYIIKVAWKPRF